MTIEELDNFIYASISKGKSLSRINLSYNQVNILMKRLASSRNNNIFYFGGPILKYRGITIFPNIISDLKCEFCGEEISKNQYKDVWLNACDKHLVKAKMFYLLGGSK